MRKPVRLVLGGRGASAGDADVWNVFVQVFTHLIAILCFVAVINIARYEKIAKVESALKKQYEDNLNALTAAAQRDEPARMKYDLQRALMDLQRQKLLLALDQVMGEERDRMGLARFRGSDDVRMVGAKIADADFKRYTEVSGALFRPEAEAQLQRRLHLKTVARAGYEDPQPEVQHWKPEQERIPENAATVSVFDPEAKEILPANRAYVQNRLLERLGEMKLQVKRLQVGVVRRVIVGFGADPESVGDDSESAWLRILKDPDATDEARRGAAAAYRATMARRLKVDLDSGGYRFESGVWEALTRPN